MKRSLLAIAIACAALVAVAGSQAARGASGHSGYTDGRYIVTFADDPAASYDGYENGFEATRPHPGQKLNADSPAVKNWQQHLVAKHDAALAKVGATKIYDYTIANNGIAADLTAAQAAALAKLQGVIGLSRDELSHPDTTLSPHFLGLDAAGGLWSQLNGAKNAGAGTVVGVIDTGIWPESAAFAGSTAIPVPADWKGTCQAGELWSKNTCNDKLIGARYYLAGFGRKFVATDENHDWPSDGARNPVLADPRRMKRFTGEKRTVTLPFVVDPKSL